MTRGSSDDQLTDFDVRIATHNGVSRRVYSLGDGPAVIVIAEMPGISPDVADFARKVAALGATAVMPSLFGVDGRDPRPSNLGVVGAATTMLGTLARACISREFTILASGKTSPAADWMRALAAEEHERCGGPGVGAVGMCFTGGFALAIATDERMLAPVVAQPSLPGALTPRLAHSIDVSPEDLRTVVARCERGLDVMGVRFCGDRMSPASRFRFLRELLGDSFLAIEIPDSAANPESPLPTPHSPLTVDLIDAPGEPTHDALTEVLEFLATRLGLVPGDR
ncbi:dienelactone hydrolase family protein [Gordonia otitidis]|uniref:dienelactone hydrolase family protein n=1 Tax=Gordonia otitidis TaxID=249058 RepID=UPI001D15E1E4|nr:dienelactone hydrolase family protein [Gordonia otitidis]UEA59596.1 dienelactone hydrolase family protein [Gordonia otitidis]